MGTIINDSFCSIRNYNRCRLDDIALLPNAPAQDEFLLHSLEQAVGGIGE